MTAGRGFNRRAFLRASLGATAVLSALPEFRLWGQPTLRASWVYLTSPGDAGWTFRHDEGRKFAAERFTRSSMAKEFQLITATAENVSDADAERVARNFASQGFDITFGTSFGFMDGTLAVAKDFPNLAFEHCSGFKVGRNMGNYFGRMYQARYLSGIVAGLMTKTNVLGYVAAIPIPEVIRILNAFYLGAKSVNNRVTMRVVGLGSFFDPPKARELALALIDQGADVLTMHEDTPAVPVAAQDRKVFSVSYQSDMSKFAPKSQVAGVFWNWGPYYLATLELLARAKLDKKPYPVRTVWGGFENVEGYVEPMVGVRNEVGGGEKQLINEDLIRERAGQAAVNSIIDAVEKARKALSSPFRSNDVVFKGPVRNGQTGQVVIAADVVASDNHLLSMDYPVEGVTGPGFFPSSSTAAPAFEERGKTFTVSGSATGIGFLNVMIIGSGGKGFSSGPRGFAPGTSASDVAKSFADAINADKTFSAAVSGGAVTVAGDIVKVSAQSGDGGVSVK